METVLAIALGGLSTAIAVVSAKLKSAKDPATKKRLETIVRALKGASAGITEAMLPVE